MINGPVPAGYSLSDLKKAGGCRGRHLAARSEATTSARDIRYPCLAPAYSERPDNATVFTHKDGADYCASRRRGHPVHLSHIENRCQLFVRYLSKCQSITALTGRPDARASGDGTRRRRERARARPILELAEDGEGRPSARLFRRLIERAAAHDLDPPLGVGHIARSPLNVVLSAAGSSAITLGNARVMTVTSRASS
jgi:hypothetical protein